MINLVPTLEEVVKAKEREAVSRRLVLGGHWCGCEYRCLWSRCNTVHSSIGQVGDSGSVLGMSLVHVDEERGAAFRWHQRIGRVPTHFPLAPTRRRVHKKCEFVEPSAVIEGVEMPHWKVRQRLS